VGYKIYSIYAYVKHRLVVNKALLLSSLQAQRFAGGTGLGLYSLAKRIDALGGKYGVRDRDDGQSGLLLVSSFILYLLLFVFCSALYVIYS
jgi:hypothetical protein